MLSYKKILIAGFTGLLVVLSSCTSMRANMYLIKQLTPQDKAEYLFNEGVDLYNSELLDRNNLKAIPKIRQYFTDTLKLDPEHPKAQLYITKIDSFKKNQFDVYIARAKALQDKDKRTDSQNYAMVLAIKKAGDIKSIDTDLIKLKTTTISDRNAVITAREEQVGATQARILAEKNPQTLTKLLNDISKPMTELLAVDPGNPVATKSQKDLDAYVASLSQKDIDTAKTKLSAKKYGEAETAVLKAERNLTALTGEPNPQVQTLKYQIYYAWGSDLLAAKKYQSASDKASLAIAVNRTQEAVDLKSKITKAASERDYDADIDDILASVDSRLDRGDPAGAMNVIQSTMPKLKVQANKNSLSSREDQVIAQMKQLYDAGIAQYNEEDYVGAKQKFNVVVKIDSNYEQAQGYLDRANTKLRALNGKD